MNVGTVLLVLLIIFLIVGLPAWPHGGFGYGYWPSGIGGVLLIIVIVMLLMGRL